MISTIATAETATADNNKSLIFSNKDVSNTAMMSLNRKNKDDE